MPERARLGLRCAVLAAAATFALSGTAYAVDIPVETTSDSGTTSDGQCSLREALGSANTDSNAFTPDCPPGSEADVVLLPAGTYTIGSSSSDDNGITGDFDVFNDPVTIRGVSASNTSIDGADKDRALDVLGSGTLTVDRVTVRNGRSQAAAAGGGIRNAGSLTVVDSVVSDNETGAGGNGGDATGANGSSTGESGALGTGGAGGAGGDGGGIANTGSLTVTRSSILGNRTGNGGAGGNGTGGNGAGGASVDNTSAGAGGAGTGGAGGSAGSGAGINSTGSLQVTDSTIADNTAGNGGAGGNGVGGQGGTGTGGGFNPGTMVGSAGGNGGTGIGGLGGSGGSGGGIRASAASTISGTTFDGNRTGSGGNGGNAGKDLGSGFRAQNGGGSYAAAAGNGGPAAGGTGGAGGSGGAISTAASTTVLNATMTDNEPGDGGTGGSAVGGNAGNAAFGVTAANGGNATGGTGGSAGTGGAAGGTPLTLTHATVDANGGGVPGTGGSASGGSKAVGGSGNNGTAIQGGVGADTGGALASGGTITLTNTIVAANADGNCSGTISNGGGNISFGDASCPGANGDPKLGVLQANGGPTQTQALGSGSAARDTAGSSACPATDQRGSARPQGPACDVGAYEATFEPPPSGGGDGGGGPGGGGGGPGTSPGQVPTPGDAVAPVFSSASLSVKTFAVNRRGPAETAVSARAKLGTTFRYALSENARVLFAIERATVGRRVGGTCRKQTRSNRRQRKCTLYVVQGRFAAQAQAGANQKAFSGRIGRKSLKPGKHRALLVATDAAGNKSAPRTLTFKVVRR